MISPRFLVMELYYTTCHLSSFFHSGDFQSVLLRETKQMTSTSTRISDEPAANMRRTSGHTESREVEGISRRPETCGLVTKQHCGDKYTSAVCDQ